MNKLNFGCGIDIRNGFDNFDFNDFDFNKFPYPVKDNTYDYILVRDVLEHLYEPFNVLEELHRISKPNAIIKVMCPYYNSAGAFNSMQHIHYFNKLSFMVFDRRFRNVNKPSSKEFEVKVKLLPTRLGMLIPRFLREKVSFVLGEIIHTIEADMKVIKQHMGVNDLGGE